MRSRTVLAASQPKNGRDHTRANEKTLDNGHNSCLDQQSRSIKIF